MLIFNRLSDLSKQFYNLIPHTKTPVIDTEVLMKEKLSMLEVNKNFFLF